MEKAKISYIVTNMYDNLGDFETMAVSEDQAINNIHYKLWFEEGIWTDMSDWYAEPAVVAHFRELRNDKRGNTRIDDNDPSLTSVRDSGSEQYVQMSFSWT